MFLFLARNIWRTKFNLTEGQLWPTDPLWAALFDSRKEDWKHTETQIISTEVPTQWSQNKNLPTFCFRIEESFSGRLSNRAHQHPSFKSASFFRGSTYKALNLIRSYEVFIDGDDMCRHMWNRRPYRSRAAFIMQRGSFLYYSWLVAAFASCSTL